MNTKQFVEDAAIALESQDIDAKHAFIEKWVPIVTNTVPGLQQQVSFLELELSAAQSEQEG